MADGIWKLYDDAGKLESASVSWSDVSTAFDTAGETVNQRSQTVRAAGWEGETATAYDGHRKELVSGIDTASTLAGDIASKLSQVAGSVRIAQGRLDGEWAKVVAIPHTGSPSGAIRFETETQEEADRVNASVTAAQGIRDELDATLAKDTAALRAAKAQWAEMAAKWESVANGSTDPFELPDDVDRNGIITNGDQTIVNTGDGDDKITVTIDPFTGDQLVFVNGQLYRIPAGQHLVIRGGGGEDTIEVPGSSDLDLTIIGGEGTDHVRGGAGEETVVGLDGDDEVDSGGGDDRISGGAGRDYLNGEGGNDNISGGEGDDTLYGLDGDDYLAGGEGQDYHEGGAGDDTFDGGAGDDILSGGLDDDTIRGGSGDDVSYAGRGNDTTYGGSGTDTAHSESGDRDVDAEHHVTVEIPDTTYFFKIEGSPEFVARVEADIEMLRASPRGQEMLANLQENYDGSGFLGMNKDTLTLREYYDPSDPNNSTASNDGHGNFEINYNTRIDTVDAASPSVVLYHELAHVYDYMNGTFSGDPYEGDDTTDHGIKEGERTATGLPIDHDDDPDTPEELDPDHPFGYTENGLRDEMGLPNRDHYR